MISKLKDTIFVIGDAGSERKNLTSIFKEKYNLLEAESIYQAIMMLSINMDYICAVLLDVPLSQSKEIRELVDICSVNVGKEIPVICFVKQSDDSETENLAFSYGVTDVINKPYSILGTVRRVQTLIDLYLSQANLREITMEQNEIINNVSQTMIDSLSAIIASRNTETGNHILRIRSLSKILMECIANNYPEYRLDSETIELIASASTLHDIGKISIPDKILNKPSRLTPEEYDIMKKHTVTGANFISQLSGLCSEDFLQYAYNIAMYHHERYDGGGYPEGLSGDKIPFCAQVVAIADVFDALTTDRSYKSAFSYEKAMNMILNGECGIFAPNLLESLKYAYNDFVKLAERYADGYLPKNDDIKLPLTDPFLMYDKMDHRQLTDIKYKTLQKYINDTIIEVDMNSKIYHIVYNSNQDIKFDRVNFLFTDKDDERSEMNQSVHPEDREEVKVMQSYFLHDFWELGLRRKTFFIRLYSKTYERYLPYKLTMMRLNTRNDDTRILLLILHCITEENVYATDKDADSVPAVPSVLHENAAVRDMMNIVIKCSFDKHLTIDASSDNIGYLLGYSAAEISEMFGNNCIELVYPGDREDLLSSLAITDVSTSVAEKEFRLQHRDGSEIWVLAKYRIVTESDGQEYVYFSIWENNIGRDVFEKIVHDMRRNQEIINNTGAIIFEWDIKNDTMYCSSQWEKRFGYMPVSKNYSKQMGIATHFHPDDLDIVRNAIKEIKTNHQPMLFDVRIADFKARYQWARITASANVDENGELVRIVGLLQDIDAFKQTEIALRESVEYDALTKLLNKKITIQKVVERLSNLSGKSMSAMLVLDLDNFKLINDNYGHLYGDIVLSKVGHALKGLFRADDIIGRIGGDEFLIFIHDIFDQEMIFNRCEILLEVIRDLIRKDLPDLDVSCSIGVVFAPMNGTEYSELFRRADEALYISKGRGKNTYTVYNAKNIMKLPKQETVRASTEIESENFIGLANASFFRFVFRHLYENQYDTKAIDDILSYIGEQFNISRVYIFENNDDNTTCSNTFEWCNKGISSEKENLQNISYITDIPGWFDVFDERGVFYCTDINELNPLYRDILAEQGIKSILQCSIMDNGKFSGYVGFDDCKQNRVWNKEQIDILEFLSEILSLFLMKKRTSDKLNDLMQNICNILDRQDAWIYVIDPETCELKYINEKVRQLSGEVELGMKCHKVFMNKEERCNSCPALHCGDEEDYSIILENSKFGKTIRAHAAEIYWDNSRSNLVTCYELPKNYEYTVNIASTKKQ